MNSFNKKVAIVTGAGQGIGYEIAKQLCGEGARVVLNDIDTTLATEAALRIGSNCVALAGDSSDLVFIHKMVETAVAEFGSTDIVIANSGITLFGDFLDYPAESFNRVMNVNLGGSFFLAQVAAKQMIRQGSGGAVLFTSSVTGHQAHKKLAAYSMTKAALEMLAKNLVIELSQYSITVNTIAPGATLTERTLDDPEYESVWSQLTPLGRPANTLDIANAALFMVSDKAKHITGQSLIIDGGWTSVSPSPF
ncbi:MAG TPA: SDR family oxidoreductase [Flavitalea sp.]|nr:SDR family oxidoreductase [Flavitalea sp.]